MVLLFEKNDITKMKVDAIVNAANSTLLGGGGVDGAIHYAAGPELLEECRTLGGCETGDAKITKGYNLPAKYVIHTVGPVYYDGNHNEKELLTSCYKNSLQIAKEKNLESIAFPLISSGIFGYPKEEAFNVAVETVKNFFTGENADIDMTVYIVLYNKSTIDKNRSKINKLQEYIDDNYVAAQNEKFFDENNMRKCNSVGSLFADGLKNVNYSSKIREFAEADLINEFDVKNEKKEVENQSLSKVSLQYKKELNEIIVSDESFIDSLLKLIDKKGLKDSDVYNMANIDRKLFSKIRNGSHPKKSTAISLCIALGLDIDETNSLLMKAGYAFSDASYFDVIIKYHIENKIYEISKINEALFTYDQPQLGGGEIN